APSVSQPRPHGCRVGGPPSRYAGSRSLCARASARSCARTTCFSCGSRLLAYEPAAQYFHGLGPESVVERAFYLRELRIGQPSGSEPARRPLLANVIATRAR